MIWGWFQLAAFSFSRNARSVTTKNLQGCRPNDEGGVHQRLLERQPVLAGDGPFGIELLGGVAPLELAEEDLVGNGFHGTLLGRAHSTA